MTLKMWKVAKSCLCGILGLALFTMRLSFAECPDNQLNNEKLVIALSSQEGGYYRQEDPDFLNDVALLVKSRANELCYLNRCGPAQRYRISQLRSRSDTVQAWTIESSDHRLPQWIQKTWPLSPVWKWVNSGYSWLGNPLWYFGHMISACTPYVNRVSSEIGNALGAAGQCITMTSRMIERWGYKEISYGIALDRKSKNKVVNQVPVSSLRKPHHVFTEVHCTWPERVSFPEPDVVIELDEASIVETYINGLSSEEGKSE